MRSIVVWLCAGCLLATGCCVFKSGAEYQRDFLFDGQSLAGWKASEDGANAFTVANGEIQIRGGRGHLYYVGPDGQAEFKNFELNAKVRTHAKANSGIYFHTRYQPNGWPAAGYEAQVNASHSDARKTGGLYAIKDVMDQPAAPDDTWFEYRIRVQGKHIQIWIDGKLTTDFTEPTGWKPPAGMEGRRLGSGTFALQAHDPGCRVEYKDIWVIRLP